MAGLPNYKTLRELGKQISPDDLQRAAEATLGYPYLLQLVGYYLLEFAGAEAAIESDAVTLAIKNARRTLADTVFEPSLNPLSSADIEFLKAMSLDEGSSKVAEIQRRLGVPYDSVQQTRARLIAAGVIASPRRGELLPELPYLAEYLRGEL